MSSKKRKSMATKMDEVDRSMFATFSAAANSLSQLYTQSTNQQKLSFQAGERHGLEKLYEWILKQKDGDRVIEVTNILCYLQDELDLKPTAPSPNQQASEFMNDDYTFSHALSSPVRRVLLNLSQKGFVKDHQH